MSRSGQSLAAGLTFGFVPCLVDTRRFCLPVKESGPSAVDNAAFTEIVRRQFDGDGVTGENPDIVLAHFAGDVGSHNVTVLQLDTKGRVGKRVGNDAFHLQGFFFSQFPLLSGTFSEPNCAETSALLQ
jgi:hypothetical protein